MPQSRTVQDGPEYNNPALPDISSAYMQSSYHRLRLIHSIPAYTSPLLRNKKPPLSFSDKDGYIFRGTTLIHRQLTLPASFSCVFTTSHSNVCLPSQPTCSHSCLAKMLPFGAQLKDVFIIHSFMRLSSAGCFLYGCMGLLLFLFKAFPLYWFTCQTLLCLPLE